MQQLWAPWRIGVLEVPKEPGCFFCRYLADDNDQANLVLYRGSRCLVLLNRFPYNNGHLLVAPMAHIGDPQQLPSATLHEMVELTFYWQGVLQQTLGAHGFNIGMNIGQVAGAGVADHLHMHIVPRWQGDTNFMPVLSDHKVILQSLQELYRLLCTAMERNSP